MNQDKKFYAAENDILNDNRSFTDLLRIRILLAVAVQCLASLVLAYFIYSPVSGHSSALWPLSQGLQNTLVLCTIATVVSQLIIRQLADFPGSKEFVYFMPSVALAFGGAALIAFAFRFDYARAAFGMSAFSVLLFLFFFHWFFGRRKIYALSIVPGGELRGINAIQSVRWTLLKNPSDHIAKNNGVVADLHHDHPDEWDRYLARCVLAGIPVYSVKAVAENLNGRVEIEHLSENNFGSVLPSNTYLKIKRAMDFLIAVFLLPVFGLVIAVAAICVKIETRGPVIFKQKRVGFRAKEFTIYKIRSMSTDAGSGPSYTASADQRITNVGKFIRRYRIDELPQILNILVGDMSWIGPRPEALDLADWYAREIPFYVYRHAVRPGLSGWAQVNQGNVAEIEAATIKLQYDFYYIKYFSPWLDLLISLRTLTTIIGGHGVR